MESLIQDLKYGLKLLWKDKAYAATAVATLAICIGANTAIFSVVNSVVLKPLPFPESDRILFMYNSYPKAGVVRASSGVPDYYDRLRDVDVFEEIALYNTPGLTIGDQGSVERIRGMGVTPSFFRLLRARPKLGRIFAPEEGELGNERKVILSFALWQERFGGVESVIGRELRINEAPYTIVGVLPRDFDCLNPEVQLWRPLAFTQEQKTTRLNNSWNMIGRLKPGATLARAQSQIDALNASNLNRFPEFKSILINAGAHTVVVPLQDDVVREVKVSLYLLWGGVLFVLLIGAVNIANVVMARSSVRMQELAIRFALGAGRWRVTRQLVTESVLLTTLSAGIGLLLGYGGLHSLSTFGVDRLPRSSEIVIDPMVVAFILALSFIVGVGIGLIPVAHALRVNMSSAFRERERAGTSTRGARVARNALVVAQIAFALVLLIGSGLLFASFRRMLAINPGFVPEQVVTGTVALPATRYGGEAAMRSFEIQALDNIRAIPGVLSAGATDTIPFGDRNSDSVILAEGYQMKPGESLVSPNRIVVTPGYFEAMRIPLLEGRFIDARDLENSQRVLVIDQRLARRFWPSSSAIGKRMWQPQGAKALAHPPEKDADWLTVVGVVGSIKLHGLVNPDERVGAYYFPYAQNPMPALTLAVRAASDPAGLVRALRDRIAGLDPELPLFDVRTMQERIDESLTIHRSPMLLATAFGMVALFLAAVGIYGLLAYTVAQRTKEIGIRMALGSSAEGIFKLILKEGVLILAIGFAIGLAGALAIGRFVRSALYGVGPFDLGVLTSAIAILALVSLVACVLPAHRATRIEPVTALRQE
ncbi:MAG: ABC transporter permease [Acidobacteriia bacterium]|nr:ABC transporter permease [Terriglobia bacterium]